IDSKFDEIVDFSEVTQYIDTPVKRYSSGMYLRLAFAVAAHLEPEILVVDEVLAVGDAEFQKRCIGKMNEVAKSGRTILFVSHNMNAVNTLCNKCIHLHKGKIAGMGNTEEIISAYLRGGAEKNNERSWSDEKKIRGDSSAQLIAARLVNSSLETIEYASIDEQTGIEYQFRILREGLNPVPNIHLFTDKGECAFISSIDPENKFAVPGIYKSVMWIPPNFLNAGMYSAGLALSTLNPVTVHFFEQDAISFEVIEDIDKRNTQYKQHIPGVVRPLLNWELNRV
ncbi:MAG: ABC transporter ATP-binding protein, partial [Bacteroidia bacterium]|nr:ABC transporter ATP-binding protein [Bacteroidia bacterium]